MGMFFSKVFADAIREYFAAKNYFEWWIPQLEEIRNLPEYKG